jgi:two-component system response regulator YesN
MAKKTDRRVKDVIAFMEDNLGQRLLLGTLAQGVNLSSTQLNYLFKSKFGVTASQYLKSLRMEKARELLETTHLSVKEVAAKVGLNDASHFVRDFKTTYGMTPKQFRNSLSGKRKRKQRRTA